MSNSEQMGDGTQWQQPTTAGPVAGWYPDPWDDRRRRYWDGHAWTGDVAADPASGQWAPPNPAAGSGWPPAPPTGSWGTPAGAWGGGPVQSAPWGAPAQGRPVGGRVHVGLVAVIAVIAVLAGIGIGSQVNATSTPSAAPTAPFGGGSTGGGATGGRGGTGSRGTGTSQLTPAQQAVVSTVDKSVVDITTELGYQNGAAAGTGMVLTADGMILTNNHVIDGATSISVTLVSTGKTYKATVLGDDVSQDVAVVQVQGASGLTPINLGTGASVRVGDTVVAIGNAGGAGGTPSAVSGQVTDLNRQITASDENGANPEQLSNLIQTDAPIQAGDSGGPLVNGRGQVIGMDTAASSQNGFSGAASEGFAIPIAQAEGIAAQIAKGQSSDKIHIGATGFLGVSVAADSGVPGSIGSGNGAQVQSVIAGSPADKAGITGGDTITAVNGKPVTSSSDLTTVLRTDHPGDNVSVTYSDQGNASHTVNVTLTTGPAA